jgi:hypothetical protein
VDTDCQKWLLTKETALINMSSQHCDHSLLCTDLWPMPYHRSCNVLHEYEKRLLWRHAVGLLWRLSCHHSLLSPCACVLILGQTAHSSLVVIFGPPKPKIAYKNTRDLLEMSGRTFECAATCATRHSSAHTTSAKKCLRQRTLHIT